MPHPAFRDQQIRFCTSRDGVRIAYAVTGEGPPLLKTANWLSHLEYDWQSPIWRPWLEELGRHFTLVRYDQRGCGLSDWDAEEISPELCVADLEAVADAARLDRFSLFGLSQGGAIAVSYAARHADRVERLVLDGAYAQGRLKRDPSPQAHEEVRTIRSLMDLGWGKGSAAFRQVFTALIVPDADPAQQLAFDALQHVSTSAHNAIRLMMGFYQLDVTDLARQVRCPTLVAHSRDDMAVPFESGRGLAGLIPDARFLPLASRNHVLLPGEPAWTQLMHEIAAFAHEAPPPRPAPASSKLAALTVRERELLELIARGLDNHEIAARLGVSAKTVRNHITSIFSKLDVAHRAQAIVLAREAGLGRTSR